jgi:hypothetical protein
MRKWLRLEDFVFYAFIRQLEYNDIRSIKLTKLMEYANAIAKKIDDITVLIYRDLFYTFLKQYSEVFTENTNTNSLELKEDITIHDLRYYNPISSVELLIAMSNKDVLSTLLS